MAGEAGRLGLSRRSAVLAIAAAPLSACSRLPRQKGQQSAQANAAAPAAHSGLVELVKLDPSIRLDIRYATTSNFTGRQLYNQPRAFLIRPAAEALVRAHKVAQSNGYGLTIFDAYRPWRITKALWDATPPGPQRNYVANPNKGSRHNRGCAVDLSLHRLDTGRLVAMPSGYDEFSPRAHRDFVQASPEALANRSRLETWMEAEGLLGISNEWWHFDFSGWQEYPILDLPFEEIG